MKVNVKDYPIYEMENKIHVPNHQPEYELPIFPAAYPRHRPQDYRRNECGTMALKARAQHTEGHHGGCGWMHHLEMLQENHGKPDISWRKNMKNPWFPVIFPAIQ